MKTIKQSEHTFIAGRTGSGKTILAYYYLSSFDFVRVLDIKGMFKPWDKFNFTPQKECAIVTEFSKLAAAARRKKYIIYRPRFEELQAEFYDAFFKWCYMQKHCTVCVDEVMGVYDTAHKVLPYHKAILTRGRELDVNIFNLTQRPSNIPQLIMSESTHFYVFNLNLEIDRQKMVNITGQNELINQPGKYTFWYYNFDMNNPKKGMLEIKKEGGKSNG